MVFNTTFNNISAISGRSVLLKGETGVPGENHRPEMALFEAVHHYISHQFSTCQPFHDRTA
jgi:hypothetical protein